MLIALTGTPGTGKSLIAKSLKKGLNANFISINDLVKRKENILELNM